MLSTIYGATQAEQCAHDAGVGAPQSFEKLSIWGEEGAKRRRRLHLETSKPRRIAAAGLPGRSVPHGFGSSKCSFSRSSGKTTSPHRTWFHAPRKKFLASEPAQKARDIRPQRIDRIAAFHDHGSGQTSGGNVARQHGIVRRLQRE